MMRKEAVDLLKKHLDSLSLEDWSVSKDACKEENITALWEIMQKFNPPIKVTQAVLDAMWKSAGHFSVIFDVGGVYNSPSGKRAYNRYELRAVNLEDEGGSKYFRYVRDNRLQCGYSPEIGDYIQADCPLALQVLLQFNTEGEVFDA